MIGGTSPCSRDDFLVALELADREADRFARTFRAKADAMDLWPSCMGFYGRDGREPGTLMAAIVVRLSKRRPVVANLHLLHTFARFRRQGLAKLLTEHQFMDSVRAGAEYFRVSAEQEALPFYRALGFRFWGEQKSGSALSIFRIRLSTYPIDRFVEIRDGVYDPEDPVVRAALNRKGKGGLVTWYEGGPR